MNGADHATFPGVHAMKRAIVPNDVVVPTTPSESSQAFAELHAIYSRRLYRTIFAITRNTEDAEDALQETFLRAYSALHTFESRSSIYAWLTRIAMNSALMILRKRRSRAEVLFNAQPDNQAESLYLEVKDSAPNPEERYELQQRQLIARRAIRSLDPQLRRPLRMRMTHGWSMREIGRVLNISVPAVKARVYRARRQLAATCADYRNHKLYGAVDSDSVPAASRT